MPSTPARRCRSSPPSSKAAAPPCSAVWRSSARASPAASATSSTACSTSSLPDASPLRPVGGGGTLTLMLSTMQDFPLTIAHVLRHGQTVHGRSQVTTFEGESTRRASFTTVAERAERLAKALQRLGIGQGDRVGTFCWNNQEHLEAYLAVPAMGAGLHT